MTDLENVVNSIAEGDDLSTTLRKHEPVPKCPNCDEEITEIGTSQRITLARSEDGQWSRETIDHLETFQCLNCFEELSVEELDEIGVPNELR